MHVLPMQLLLPKHILSWLPLLLIFLSRTHIQTLLLCFPGKEMKDSSWNQIGSPVLYWLPQVVFEILDYYILINNYALQYQIIFCLPLGYLAMKYEAGRQKPSFHDPGWCFKAEDSRNQFWQVSHANIMCQSLSKYLCAALLCHFHRVWWIATSFISIVKLNSHQSCYKTNEITTKLVVLQQNKY